MIKFKIMIIMLLFGLLFIFPLKKSVPEIIKKSNVSANYYLSNKSNFENRMIDDVFQVTGYKVLGEKVQFSVEPVVNSSNIKEALERYYLLQKLNGKTDFEIKEKVNNTLVSYQTSNEERRKSINNKLRGFLIGIYGDTNLKFEILTSEIGQNILAKKN